MSLASALEGALPEFAGGRSVDDYLARFRGPHLCMVALVDEVPAAFKLGYALSADTFYSWLGGVLPPFRSQGLAQQLLAAQEQWVKAQGYRALEVKSSDRFPAMLGLLAKNHYQALGRENNQVRFRKTLIA